MSIIKEEELIKRLTKSNNVLLIEPDYERQYVPLGLAKIASLVKEYGGRVTYSKRFIPEDFDLICVTTLFTNDSDIVMKTIKGCQYNIWGGLKIPIIVGGVFASLEPEYIIKNSGYNVDVFVGFSEILDSYLPDYSVDWQVEGFFKDAMIVFTTRGCPNKCLAGNTLVNTIYGDIPIKDLVGKEIGVYTYSPITKEVFISKAIHVRKMGVKELVRVHFDDKTFIDCTPDHRFLTFKNGNQHANMMETEKEAKDLSVGESVRAIKTYNNSKGYKSVYWGRRKRQLQHRLIMAYKLKRRLLPKEEVHHKDENPLNNHPFNLKLTNGHKEHYQHHPEISERMKRDNPQKYCTKESYKKIAAKIRGQKRGLETRLKHRELMLGKRNPMYIHGRSKNKSRIQEINHKVVKVEYLNKKEMTYDLEVPETGWFFANNVLVHNCGYCMVWRMESNNVVPTPNWKENIETIDRKICLVSDNNFLNATPKFIKEVVDTLNKCDKRVIFNNGVDCMMVNKEIANLLSSLKYTREGFRMAFDKMSQDGHYQRAMENMKKAGFKAKGKSMSYVLFNFNDTPQDTLYRMSECWKYGSTPYLIRYRPLNQLKKRNTFMGKYWTNNLVKAFNQFAFKFGYKDSKFEDWIKTEETVKLGKEDWDKFYFRKGE